MKLPFMRVMAYHWDEKSQLYIVLGWRTVQQEYVVCYVDDTDTTEWHNGIYTIEQKRAVNTYLRKVLDSMDELI